MELDDSEFEAGRFLESTCFGGVVLFLGSPVIADITLPGTGTAARLCSLAPREATDDGGFFLGGAFSMKGTSKCLLHLRILGLPLTFTP